MLHRRNPEIARVLTDQASDGHLVIDAGWIVDANAAALGFLGISDPHAILGRRPTDVSPETQPDGQSSVAKFARQESRVKTFQEYQFPWVFQTSAGKPLAVHLLLKLAKMGEHEVLLAFFHPEHRGSHVVATSVDSRVDSTIENEQNGLPSASDERLLQLVLDTIPAAVFWKDRGMKFLGCNEQFALDAGLSNPSQVVGKTDADMPWRSEDAEAYFTADQQVIDSGTAEIEIVERQLRANGQHAWVETNKVPIRDGKGAIVGVLGSYRDITSRRKAEESLRQYSSNLRLLSEMTADKAGGAFLQSCAEGLAALLGVPLAIVGKRCLDKPESIDIIAHWGGLPSALSKGCDLSGARLDRRVFAEPTRAFNEARVHYGGNDLLECTRAESFVSVPIHYPDGSVCGCFIALSNKQLSPSVEHLLPIVRIFACRMGISIERAQTMRELEMRIERASLLESVSRQIRASLEPREIVQSTVVRLGLGMKTDRCFILKFKDLPQPHVALVSEYTVEGVDTIDSAEINVSESPMVMGMIESDSVVAINDLNETEWTGKQGCFFNRANTKSMIAVQTSYQNRVNGILVLEHCHEHRQWTEDECDLVKVVADQVGIALGQAAMLEKERNQGRELVEKNKALGKAKSEADAANQAKSEFLSRMSHELRTPLNAILGFSQVMVRDANATDEQRENLETINRSGAHLLEMINDVLEMARIESGEVVLEPTSFELRELFNELMAMFSARVSSQVTLSLDILPDVPTHARTDERRLRQILINLIGNAIKFTKEGHIMLRVRAGEIGNGGASSAWMLRLMIEDTGEGIGEEERAHLFQPFSQTESGRKLQQGTGLGLPISRQFARLLGGDVTCESSLGEGSIFKVTIPCEEADPSELNDRLLAEHQRVQGLAEGQEPVRVLVVDDHDESREWLARLLESIGMLVMKAENGEAGLKLCGDFNPRLVLMDIHMPVMDGHAAALEIRAQYGEEESCPVLVALTASAFIGDKDRLDDGPFDLYLAKPVHEKSLVQVFESLLDVAFSYEERPRTPAERHDTTEGADSSNNLIVVDDLPAISIETAGQMPSEWMEEMDKATACLNLNRTEELVLELKKVNPVAAKPLLLWCHEYQFDELQNFLRIVKEDCLLSA